MSLWIGECPRCRTLPRLVPFFGKFYWSCECPPARTYTTDNTAPIMQERLGPEFERVLYDNLWDLYAR
jgi:hypothetical protein